MVNDEPNITALVAYGAPYEGFSIRTTPTERAALTTVSQFSPVLVILNLEVYRYRWI